MKKALSILVVLGLILLGTNAFAVTLQWDGQTDCDGFYLYWYTDTPVPAQKTQVSGGASTTGSITATLTDYIVYKISATAYKLPVSGTTNVESLHSNVVLYRQIPASGGGNTSTLPGQPTGVGITGTDITWVAPAVAGGVRSPQGYNIYYIKTSVPGTVYSATVTGGTTLKIAIANLVPPLVAATGYTFTVKAWAWGGVDGQAILEGLASTPYVFTYGGGSGTTPTKPSNLVIKP